MVSTGVYDSEGKANWFLENYTTSGEWEIYKLNLYEWLKDRGLETGVYGIILSETTEKAGFLSYIDWISIHNHIFWDVFEDEGKISYTDNIKITKGDVTLSKTTDELLPNNGFENGFEGWRPRAKWSIDRKEFHSGDKSAILQGTVDPAKDASAYLDTDIYRGILKRNTSYRFSAWIKGDVADAVRASIRQFSSADPWSGWKYFSKRNKTYEDWTYSERIITTPGDINGDFSIRIYGGGNPAVWIDDVSLIEDIYVSSGMLTSITKITENPIISVTPEWNSTEPEGTSIDIEISLDNGTTWRRAENGAAVDYPASGENRYLLYKVFLRTGDASESPILHEIALVYEEL